nr:hypothetical protein [Tanacetum cinerariifolium]
MDAYRDEGIGDVIFGEPFLREVGINAKRFEGMITIYNDNESVTYQLVRSHPRFKHHTNEQCNKILPLLKVNFEVLEDMDAYHDEGMGDVIFGEPFLREVGINAKRFEGMITIYNDNESVTYQLVRSHPRKKYRFNLKNDMPPRDK